MSERESAPESSDGERSAGSSSPQRPKDPRVLARRRWWLIVPLSLGLLLAAAVVTMPWWLSGELVRDQVVRTLTDELGLRVQVDGLEYHPLYGLTLTGVRVKAPAGFEREPVTAEKLAVRYDLLPLVRGEVVVRSVVLQGAHFVFETAADGGSNLDALLADIDAALGPDTGPSRESDKDDPPGSLTPIGIRIEDIALGPLSIEIVGDGPNAALSNVWLRGRGRLGTSTLTASVTASIEPSPEQRNLSFTIPAPEGATRGAMTAKFRLPVNLHAKTDKGFRLAETLAALDVKVLGKVERPTGPLPPLDLSAQLRAHADPAAGFADINRLRVALNGRTLLDARALARGMGALVGAAGPKDGSLAYSLGLEPGEAPDRIEAEVRALSLPLTELAPLAKALLPELVDVAGHVEARELAVAGSVGALVEGRPPVLTGRLRSEAVRCDWPGVLQLDRLDGDLQADRPSTGTVRTYEARGQFDVRGLTVAGQRVKRGDLQLALSVENLEAATGATTATVTASVDGLRTPPLSASAAQAQVYLRGRDPLAPGREATAPVTLTAAVQATRVRIGRGETLSIRKGAVRATVGADRLIEPSRTPWDVDVEADVRGFRVPGFRTSGGQVRIRGTSDDVRRAGFSPQLSLTGNFVKPESVGFSADRLRLDGQIGGRDIRRRRAAGWSFSTTLPARVALRLDAWSRQMRYEETQTPLKVHVDGTLDFTTGLLQVRSGRVRIGRAARLSVFGRLERLFEGPPRGRIRADLRVPDLATTWRRVPVAFRGSAADLKARGELTASLAIRGRWPASWTERIDWSRPPAQGRLQMSTRNADFSSPTFGFDLKAMTATVTAQLAPQVAVVSPRVSIGRVWAAAMSATDCEIDGTVGLEDDVWRAMATAQAAQIVTGFEDQSVSSSTVTRTWGTGESATFDLQARYAPRGDLAIERLAARLPSVGVAATAQGRLRRAPGGDFVPDLAVSVATDLQPLSRLVPALTAGAGQASAQLDVRPGPGKTLRLTGNTAVEAFDWQGVGWSVRKASGAVPVSQTLYLPPSARPPEGAAGWLADDLESRLAELVARLQRVRVVVDPSTDILAIAPRTADHYALSPYRNTVDAELVAERLEIADTPLTALRAEARVQEGVLRIDRFQAGLWQGDLLFDAALQATPDLDIKTRIRGTMTDLNLDIPYAKAKGIEPVSNPDETADYLASGVMDVEFGLNQRALEGRVDVVRLSRALVERFFGALDPSGRSSAAEALGYSEIAAVRPVAAKLWIAQNLLNVQFEWERVLGFDDPAPWWLALDAVLFAPRLVSAWILGGAWVIPTVNNSVKRASVFNFLDPYIGPGLNRTSALLAGFQSRVVSSAEIDGLAAASP